MRRLALLCAALVAMAAPARAETGAAPLALDDVLAASALHFPAILKSLAERDAAAGDVLAADGAFDVVFSVDAFDRVNGYYSGRVVNSKVSRNLGDLGANVYGAYRISDGDFPIYEDEYYTNTGGEAKIGVLFSLLRDRAFDARRFKQADARLALREAEFEVLLTRIGVQRRAVLAYWRWVAAGRKLRVYEELLRIAQNREQGLEEQVRQGARAKIFLTENRQNITRRQRLVIEARRDYEIAANELSLYYRGPDGAPQRPAPDQLPPQSATPAPVPAETAIAEAAIADALASRPELDILQTALRRASAETRLSRNALKPRLDLKAEASRDFGAVAEGGASRDSTDAIIGFRFTVPLQQREARGRLRAAEAEYEALRQARRQAAERIELEIRNILIHRDVASELVRIADLEVAQTRTMEEAERERFASGASDFFVVNIREETAANARIRSILARLDARIAAVDYDAATVNLDNLGLTEAVSLAANP